MAHTPNAGDATEVTVSVGRGTATRNALPWNKRERERKRPGAVGPWEVGVAGPEANPAYSEAKRRAGFGALPWNKRLSLRDVGDERRVGATLSRPKGVPTSARTAPNGTSALFHGRSAWLGRRRRAASGGAARRQRSVGPRLWGATEKQCKVPPFARPPGQTTTCKQRKTR